MTSTTGATTAALPGQHPVTLADAAEAYAALGWRVFPVQPGAKVPRFRRAHDDDTAQAACPGGWKCGRLGHGFKDATADPDRVRTWWRRWPDSNVGVATGSPAGDGTSSPDVLDVDVKDGAPGRASYERLRDAGLTTGAWAAAVTPSGGWHLFYDGTIQNSATLKKAGIDFRSCGGYVVADPSVVRARPNGGGRWVERRYAWAWFRLENDTTLEWPRIRDFLNPPPPPRDMRFYAPADHVGPIVTWFGQQPVGSRNNALFWAACRILESGYGEERLDDLRTEARMAGLADGEIVKTFGSAVRRVFGSGAGGGR